MDFPSKLATDPKACADRGHRHTHARAPRLCFRDEAVKWYTLAAEQGYTFAQYNLALKFFRGEGVA